MEALYTKPRSPQTRTVLNCIHHVVEQELHGLAFVLDIFSFSAHHILM